MRTTFGVQFYCRKSRANKKGEAPIEISLIMNGERLFFNLPRKENPLTFKSKQKKGDLSDYLESVRRNINASITDLISRGISPTPERIKEYLQNGGIKEYTLDDLGNEFILSLGDRDITEETRRKYIRVIDSFKAYKGAMAEVGTITKGDINGWIMSLKTLKQATLVGWVTKLKTVIVYAIDSGYLKTNPFNGIKVKKPIPSTEFLTVKELELIESVDLQSDRLETVRDCFLFACYSGLAFIDLKNLRKEDIQITGSIGVIQKKRIKTSTEYTSVVLPKGMEILARNGGELRVLTNQVLNRYLLEIETLCGLKKHLHMHLARHTYATNLLNSGVRLEVVSKALGHSNTVITQKVYAPLLKETIACEIAEKLLV